MIHICYTLFDKDGRHLPLPVTVHLLHDNTLTQDNHDKLNGMAFLSNAHGVNMNPYPLVKAM